MMHSYKQRLNRSSMTTLALVILLPLAAIGLFQLPATGQQTDAQLFDSEMLLDPIALLQERMDRGEVKLEWSEPRGYLDSMMEVLDIPVSSQTLVFSKTSFQSPRITPETPRALYFNDDVYLGWVNGGPVVEIAAVNPQRGTIFYTLSNDPEDEQKFLQEGARCVQCHLPARTNVPVPRLLVMSVLPNRVGSPIGPFPLFTTDESPLRERWGGWYVTGKHGEQIHRGNLVIGDEFASDIMALTNTIDLSNRFDRSPYPSGHSDVVALTVLAHQSHIHNLIGEASNAVRTAVNRDVAARSGDSTRPAYSRRTMSILENVMETLLRAMLFSGAEPLTGPVEGTTSFTAEFQKMGPFDGQGRSLRDLDLDGRLLRYPLSYLIYSNQFDGMPVLARDYAYSRLREILEGGTDPEYAHLSATDRKAILEILEATKPDFKAWTRSTAF